MEPTTIIAIAAAAFITNLVILIVSFIAHKKMARSIDRSLNKIEACANEWDKMAEKHGFEWR